MKTLFLSLLMLVASGTAMAQTACTASGSDVPGYTRQCSASAVNSKGPVAWDNTFASVAEGPFPGGKGWVGQKLTMTIDKSKYVSLAFNTGTATSGFAVETNPTFGFRGLSSISTKPGDFFGGSVVPGCTRESLQVSVKQLKAACKLKPNTDYYWNVSGMDYFPPHEPMWPDQASTVYGWTPYFFNN